MGGRGGPCGHPAHRTSCKTPVIAKPVTDVTGCGNPFPFGFVQGYYGCPCCGAQNFCAALRRTLEILTAATRSPRFLCHWQRSVRSPHRPASTHSMLRFRRGDPCGRLLHRTPCNASVGATLAVARPLYSLQKTVSLRTSDRCHWCGSPSPVPLAPLPKGAGTARP